MSTGKCRHGVLLPHECKDCEHETDLKVEILAFKHGLGTGTALQILQEFDHIEKHGTRIVE